MRLAAAAFLVALAPGIAHAQFCTEKTPRNRPCKPRPGEATDDAKKRILDVISAAQALEADVRLYENEYRSSRAANVSAEVKLAALKKYRDKKEAQNLLYKEALNEVGTLYHVAPDRRQLTIAPSSDPNLGYVTGLTAAWNPQVTASGPDVLLVIKIKGSDNQDHYGGGVMDPSDSDGKDGLRAMTFEDGRTVILQVSFDQAARSGNPGYLAHLLYHESRHFNQLSRVGADGKRRGWASKEEDEKDAYEDDNKLSKLFGLTEKEAAGIRESFNTYRDAVAQGNLTWRDPDPRKEALRKEYYERHQINLAEEFSALTARVQVEKEAQEAMQRRLEEERRQREKDEAERRRTQEAAAWRYIEDVGRRCGYRMSYQADIVEPEYWLGFQDDEGYFFLKRPFYTPLRVNDLSVALLVSRACNRIESHIDWPSPLACNPNAALDMRSVAAQPDIEAKLDYMFGLRSRRSACINSFFDRAAEIGNADEFMRFAAKYHRQLKQEREELDRRWHPKEPARRGSGADSNPPPDRDNRRNTPDHDEVWRRVNPIIGR